jgi:hypothetical protein
MVGRALDSIRCWSWRGKFTNKVVSGASADGVEETSGPQPRQVGNARDYPRNALLVLLHGRDDISPPDRQRGNFPPSRVQLFQLSQYD